MSKPLVSVGIPFFNAEATLLDSIKSVFCQTYTNWELLLVDDGSTDNSLKIAQSIDDPRVRVLPADNINLKVAARHNQIAREAKGYYIAKLDSDDLATPDRLAKQVHFLENNPDVDVVGSGSFLINNESEIIGVRMPPKNHQQIFKKYFWQIFLSQPTIMARAEWFRNNLYDEKAIRCEDYELWLRCRNTSTFANLPEKLCFYREATSFTFRNLATAKRNSSRFVWRHCRSEIGLYKTFLIICTSYLTIVSYGVACLLGFERLLLKKRNKKNISYSEKSNAEKMLSKIRDFSIPQKNSI